MVPSIPRWNDEDAYEYTTQVRKGPSEHSNRRKGQIADQAFPQFVSTGCCGGEFLMRQMAPDPLSASIKS